MTTAEPSEDLSSGPAPASPLAGVVAIGASAGGLPALQEFLSHAPGASGLAWVVVQHLDPTRGTLLTHLLQRDTLMPVREVSDRDAVRPDTVYVIPPNATLTLIDGHFHVAVPLEPRGWRHPIDDLFESMAKILGPRSAAVVLSGSGSDGTSGLRAVHEAGGVTAVQQPQTAQFDAMPRSALKTGLVDLVAPPAALAPDIVQALAARAAQGLGSQASASESASAAPSPADARAPGGLDAEVAAVAAAPEESGEPAHDPQRLVAILRLLQSRGCHDFFLYKRSTLLRRIQRRMGIHRIATMQAYVDLLNREEAEVDLLSKELLIGVTSFFRDTPVWQALKQDVLPALLKAHGDGWHMRAWVAGCSTGEEAYSLAITFREVLEALPAYGNCTLQVFATDLSKDAIDRARRGVFPATINGEVSAKRLERYFTPQDGGWRIAKEVREMVVFAPHDLTVDPPFTKLDLLSCRNLLIYLTAPLQRRLLPLFHYSLRADGVLLLGSSETIGRFDDLFEATDARLRLYRRRAVGHTVPVPDFSLRPVVAVPHPEPAPVTGQPANKEPAVTEEPTPPHSLQVLVDRYLMQQWAPPSVLVNDRGDILYINGRTGRYLEPAAGKANWNVHVMARDGLRAPLVAAMRQAAGQAAPVEVPDVPLDSPTGPPGVHLSVQSMDEVPGLKGDVLIVFRELQPPNTGHGRRRTRSAVHQELEAELQRAREEAQSLREEMRASQEELQAANEELQSTNEELQSTNEELTSSKEEMQAMNDELQAVNAELQAKLDDLAIAQSDMSNLLNSTDIATLFLDKSLHVRRFTERARKVISLRDGDVGRPLSDLTTSLEYPTMEDDVRDMLRTLVVCEKQVRSRDGLWYAVRIMPYRTQEDAIEGAVVTFVDISTARAPAAQAGASAPDQTAG